MSLSNEFSDFLMRSQTGQPLTARHRAVAIACHPNTFLQYMVDNNPVGVYTALHKSNAPLSIGKNAPFTPDKSRAEGELKLLLDEGNFDALNTIIGNVKFNPNANNYTVDKNLLKELTAIGIFSKDGGYQVVLTASAENVGGKPMNTDSVQTMLDTYERN